MLESTDGYNFCVPCIIRNIIGAGKQGDLFGVYKNLGCVAGYHSRGARASMLSATIFGSIISLIETCIMKRSGNNLFAGIAILIGIFSACVCVEVFLRLLGLGYARSGHISDPYLHHVNPSSFEFVAHSPAGEFKSFKMRYNKWGFRQTNMENAGKAKYTLALLGDSFTLSRELPDDSTFAGILEKAVADSCAVINFGVASYSPILYAVQWQRIVKAYKPTHVLVQLYINDAEDDAGLARIARYSPEGEVLAVPGPSSGLLTIKKSVMQSYLIRFAFKTVLQLKWFVLHSDEFGNAVGGFIEPNPEIPDISKKCMLQLSRQVQKTGAKFMITVIPSKCRLQGQQCDTARPEYSLRWREWAESNGIQFLDLVAPFHAAHRNDTRLFFDRDIHLNGYGSRIVAQQILCAWPELFNNQRANRPVVRPDHGIRHTPGSHSLTRSFVPEAVSGSKDETEGVLH